MNMQCSLPLLVLSGSLVFLISSCNPPRPCEEEIVSEVYVHPYGPELDPGDWFDRGRHGSIVSVQKDGVTVTRTYSAGVLHGECTYTFPHRETIARREIYDRGTLTRICECRIGGIPLKQIDYDSPSGYSVTVWDESGSPRYRERYENENLASGEYYTADNLVESRVEDYNGLRTLRDEHGGLVSIDTISNGQMTLRTTYHPNGVPATVTPYFKGVIEGERRTYLPGGEPATIEAWSNDRQEGVSILFEHGEKISETTYVNGMRHGPERRYRGGVNVVQEFGWVAGRRQGPCYTYVGDTSRVDWYYGDRLVNKATYDVLKSRE